MNNTSKLEFFKNHPGLTIIISLIFFISIIILAIPLISLINPNNKHIEGDPYLFDPIGQYERIRNFAGGDDLELGSIKAEYVKRDGTLDLHAKYKSNVTYKFYKQLKSEKNENVPFGAEQSSPKYKYIIVTISKPYHLETWSYAPGRMKAIFHLGMYKESYTIFTHPKISKMPNCSLKKVWDSVIAIEKNLPQDAVAIIEYEKDKFNFYIKNTSINYEFNANGMSLERR